MPRVDDGGGGGTPKWLTEATMLKSSRRPKPKPKVESQQSIYDRMAAFQRSTSEQQLRERWAFGPAGAPPVPGQPLSEQQLRERWAFGPAGAPPLVGQPFPQPLTRQELREAAATMRAFGADVGSSRLAGPGHPIPAVSRRNLMESRLRIYYRSGEPLAQPYAGGGGGYYYGGGGRGGGGGEVKDWLNALYAWNI